MKVNMVTSPMLWSRPVPLGEFDADEVMNDDHTDDDDNDDDNNDNENKDNNNNKNNKIDYLQAGTSTSNGKGLFKSMIRKKYCQYRRTRFMGSNYVEAMCDKFIEEDR